MSMTPKLRARAQNAYRTLQRHERQERVFYPDTPCVRAMDRWRCALAVAKSCLDRARDLDATSVDWDDAEETGYETLVLLERLSDACDHAVCDPGDHRHEKHWHLAGPLAIQHHRCDASRRLAEAHLLATFYGERHHRREI